MKTNKNISRTQVKNTLSIICNIAVITFGTIGFLLKGDLFSASTWEYFTQDSNLFCVIACVVCLFFQLKSLLRKKPGAKLESGLSSTNTQIPNWSINLKYLATCTVAVTFFVVLFVLVPMCANITYTGITYTGTNAEGVAVPATAASSSSSIQILMQACPKDGSPAGIGLALWAMFTQDVSLYHHLLVPVLAMLSLILWDQKSKSNIKITLTSLIFPCAYYFVLASLNYTGIADGPYPFLQVSKMALWQNILWFVLLLVGCYLIAFAIFKLWNGRNIKQGKHKI